MLKLSKAIIKKSIADFERADASTYGAAMSFYAVTAFVPVLVIVITVAGFAFGRAAARGSIVEHLRGILGQNGADLVQAAIQSTSHMADGTLATLISIAGLILIASGAFVELQRGLNAIWCAKPIGQPLQRIVRARALSFLLVITVGLLLLISLIIDTMLTALGGAVDVYLPFSALLLRGLNALVSFALIALLFAAIYKILPAKNLSWGTVAIGGMVTAALFEIGKLLIGSYLGSRNVGSGYGAAGALIALLFWIYYSAQIFLFGAALTKAFLLAQLGRTLARHGTQRASVNAPPGPRPHSTPNRTPHRAPPHK